MLLDSFVQIVSRKYKNSFTTISLKFELIVQTYKRYYNRSMYLIVSAITIET